MMHKRLSLRRRAKGGRDIEYIESRNDDVEENNRGGCDEEEKRWQQQLEGKTTTTSSKSKTTSTAFWLLVITFILSVALYCKKTIVGSTTGGGAATYSSHHQLISSCQQRDDYKDQQQTKRWSERTRIKSKVRSIFNCDNLTEGCLGYFYPANFFDKECGLGRDYVYQIQDLKAMLEKNTLWPNMPDIGYPTLTAANLCLNETYDPLEFESSFDESTLDNNIGETIHENDRCLTERLSMIHVHKSGGTSLHRTFDYLEKYSGAELVRHKWFISPRRAIDNLTAIELERLANIEVGSRLELDWPNEGKKYNGTVIHKNMKAADTYTILFDDDSVEMHNLAAESFRLLGYTDKLQLPSNIDSKLKYDDDSSIEEVKKNTMASLKHATHYPSSKFEPEDHVMFAVIRDPTERFISSIGQAMGGMGSKRNVIGISLQKECIKSTSAETLKCMAKYVRDHGHWIELHFAPQVIDISFTVMFQDVPVGIFPFAKLGKVLDYLGNAGNQELKVHRDRPHPVLKNMSIHDYDEESLRIVCEIYAMDVIMQRSMGQEVPRCDPFI